MLKHMLTGALRGLLLPLGVALALVGGVAIESGQPSGLWGLVVGCGMLFAVWRLRPED